MMVASYKIIFMEMEKLYGKMEIIMMEHGKEVKWMELVVLNIMMHSY